MNRYEDAFYLDHLDRTPKARKEARKLHWTTPVLMGSETTVPDYLAGIDGNDEPAVWQDTLTWPAVATEDETREDRDDARLGITDEEAENDLRWLGNAMYRKP